MPKVKSEKRSSGEKTSGDETSPTEEVDKKTLGANKKTSGWGTGGKLFGTEKTESTFQGAGFKDKDKALETIQLLDGRDVTFQFQIITSMYHRAKVILKRTKDAEKVNNLTEAIDTFEKWLDDYRSHSRAKENFGYLPLDTVVAYKPLAKHYKIKVDGKPSFVEIYTEADGDHKKLRNVKLNKDEEKSITWDVHRNNNIRVIDERIKKGNLALYETDAELKGLPSKEHVEMIMWGYSSEVSKIKKVVPQIEEKFN